MCSELRPPDTGELVRAVVLLALCPSECQS